MMPVAAAIVNRLTMNGVELDPFRAIRSRIKGWSLEQHYIFFTHLVAQPQVKSVLVCGVYHGLDLALIQHAAKIARRTIELTGVDLFSAEPCADWTPEQKAKGGWKEAGFGEPPSFENAVKNAPGAMLVRAKAADYMLGAGHAGMKFDAIFLDTSHDEPTVREEIGRAIPILNAGGVLAGDDYNAGPADVGWGVDRAVQALLPHHVVLFGRIWMAI